jgi:hypothetical protein
MRFVDLNGEILDIYQAPTHLVNENGIDHAEGIRFMIDKALGPEQFFGIFGTHYDFSDDFFGTAVSIAKERDVPLISAAQALRWMDGRNSSHFDRIAWEDATLTFDVHVGSGTDTITAMLPVRSSAGRIAAIECAGETKAYQAEMIKGLEYALFSVRSGRCNAIYGDQMSAASEPSNGTESR